MDRRGIPSVHQGRDGIDGAEFEPDWNSALSAPFLIEEFMTVHCETALESIIENDLHGFLQSTTVLRDFDSE
jgi:hypothetical protein